jgi:hypothetical protein
VRVDREVEGAVGQCGQVVAGQINWPLVAGAAAVVTVLLATTVGVRLRRAGTVPVGRECEVRNHRAGRRRIW